jgi:hypothetical protein
VIRLVTYVHVSCRSRDEECWQGTPTPASTAGARVEVPP